MGCLVVQLGYVGLFVFRFLRSWVVVVCAWGNSFQLHQQQKCCSIAPAAQIYSDSPAAYSHQRCLCRQTAGLLPTNSGSFADKQRVRMACWSLRFYAIRNIVAAFSLLQTGNKRVDSGHT